MGRIRSLNKLRAETRVILSRFNRYSRKASIPETKFIGQRNPTSSLGRRLFKTMRNTFAYKTWPSTWNEFFESDTDRVTITVDQNTAPIPWELAHDGREYLCTKYKITRRLRIRTDWVGGDNPRENRRKNALVIGLDYADYYRSNLPRLAGPEDEAHAVASRLKGLGYRILGEGPVTGKRATLSNMIRLLKNDGNALGVFHFAGHGSGDALCLADRDLTIPHLRHCFSHMDAPFLTFLNACSTNQIDRTGLVKAITSDGGDQIIATFWSVYDEPATEFANAFYAEMEPETRVPVPDAVYSARRRLMGRYKSRYTWPAFVAYGGEFPLRYKSVEG